MLKTRIVGVVVVKGGIAVQSIGFHRYLPLGRPSIAIEYLNRWGIDEVILLDIDATWESRPPDLRMMQECASRGQMPLAAGGGIRSLSDISGALLAGADKVVVNTAASEDSSLISEGAGYFGSQCIIVSIDAQKLSDGSYEAFTRGGSRPTGSSPAELAIEAETRGAGEVFLNSIDRDGSCQGYDLDLIRSVVDAVTIPVIACGGAGHPDHLREAMALGVSGVAAANFFHYSEHSVIVAKSYLKSRAQNIRLDSYVTYGFHTIGDDGRIRKGDDGMLQKLRFVDLPEEVI